MAQLNNTRTCLNCDKPLKGRNDKKFCDDFCRNNYNNQLRSIINNQVKDINSTLAKNRRILKSLLPETEKTITINKEKLQRLEFNFKYITHTYVTQTGKTYYYCYDHGYLPLENDWYLIVRKKQG
ncbi:MAG: hypothetical protein WDO19_28150 [Bacteroidota bacterium]